MWYGWFQLKKLKSKGLTSTVNFRNANTPLIYLHKRQGRIYSHFINAIRYISSVHHHTPSP